MFSVCIFDNYSDKNLIVNYPRKDVEVSTIDFGGYDSSRFTIPYLSNYNLNFWINKHVEIYDIYGDKVFEGAIEEPSISGEKIELEAVGYFTKSEKISAGPIYFSGNKLGGIVTSSISNSGSGYTVGDVLSVSGGSNGEITVDSVTGTGNVEEIIISDPGANYSVGVESCSGGTGSSFTLSIDSVEAGSDQLNIAKFMVDLVPFWRDDYSKIFRMDRTNTGPLNLTRKDNVFSILDDLRKEGKLFTYNYFLGRQNRVPYLLLMYNDRILEEKREPDIKYDEADWVISIHNIIAKQPLDVSVNTNDLLNNVFVEFNDPDLEGASFTTGQRNIESIKKYGLRQGVIPIGEALPETAQTVEDLAIKYRSRPHYSSTIRVSGNVIDKGGSEAPIWKIKAGDMIKIRDIEIGLEGLEGSRLAGYSVVSRTNYNHSRKIMNLTLDKGKRLDLMLKRLGV